MDHFLTVIEKHLFWIILFGYLVYLFITGIIRALQGKDED